jgi:hypothetical protein
VKQERQGNDWCRESRQRRRDKARPRREGHGIAGKERSGMAM